MHVCVCFDHKICPPSVGPVSARSALRDERQPLWPRRHSHNAYRRGKVPLLPAAGSHFQGCH